MNAYEKMIECIQWALDNKTSYQIAKELEINNRTANRYQNGETPIENMALKTAKIFYEYYKGEFEMENKVKEIIAGVENWKVKLNDEYDMHEIREEEYISHWTEDESLEVYFAEKKFVKDAREKDDVEELLESLNDLEDRFDYNKVVAYDAGSGTVWL